MFQAGPNIVSGPDQKNGFSRAASWRVGTSIDLQPFSDKELVVGGGGNDHAAGVAPNISGFGVAIRNRPAAITAAARSTVVRRGRRGIVRLPTAGRPGTSAR